MPEAASPPVLDVSLRLGQTLTPEFSSWLASEIVASGHNDLEIGSAQGSRTGALGSNFAEVLIHLHSLASAAAPLMPVAETMVKPALEFLWGKLFEFFGKAHGPAATLPPQIQVFILGNVYNFDPAKLPRQLPPEVLSQIPTE